MKTANSINITQSNEDMSNENKDNGTYDKLKMYIFTLENSLQEKNSQIDLLESENQILNRDKSHMCPIDSQLEGIESIEECVQILQNIPPVI